MTRPQRFEDKRTIPGVQSDIALDKLRYALSRRFTLEEAPDSGNGVRLHLRVSVEGGRKLDLRIYGNDTVYCSASPGVPNALATEAIGGVFQCCEASTYKLTGRGLFSVTRAQGILEWVEAFAETEDVSRIIVVVLSDTVIEMLVTEMMRDKGIVDGRLLREGIPAKLDNLRENGLLVYKDPEIRQLRILRNRAVHEGGLPHAVEVLQSKTLARDFFAHY